MSHGDDESTRIHPGRRLAAIAALCVPILLAVLIGLALSTNGLALCGALSLLILTVAAGFAAITRHGAGRVIAAVVAVAAVAGQVALVLSHGRSIVWVLALVVLVALYGVAARFALRAPSRKRGPEGESVGAAAKGVLIVNLKSGGGKAEEFHLVDEAARRGIETVILRPGNDLLQLAEDAIARGADVIGMAGGDGSQALVATVAMQHDIPHVCIPNGTRNHFALDLGLDREDVVGALDAFAEGLERRIDLARVNGRVFVNNASLGVYAKVVQSPEYRDAKFETWAGMLPDLLGPGAPPIDLAFTGPGGTVYDDAPLVLVSNNAYQLTRLAGAGTRARIDEGVLGVVAARVVRPSDVAQLFGMEMAGQADRYQGLLQWTAPTFDVRSGARVEVGLDGEALVLDAPLHFESLPGALRVRIPRHAPGLSPAATAAPLTSDSLRRLLRLAAGHPAPSA